MIKQWVSTNNQINAELINRIYKLFSIVDIAAIGMTKDIASLGEKSKSKP